MADTPFQPTIALEAIEVQSEAERNFIDETPANLFPENSDSNWGFKRKLFCDKVQIAIDQLATIYQERFIDTSTQFLDEWEEQYLVPIAPTGLDVISRRSIVKNRLKKGSLSRDRISHMVENAILSTLGTPTQMTPLGVPLDANGLTLYGEAVPSALPQYYRIYYNPDTFSFEIYVRSDIPINVNNLNIALKHFTPGGTLFAINNILANIRDYQRTVLSDGPTGYWPLQTTFGTGFPWNSIAGLSLTLIPNASPATSATLVQRAGIQFPDLGARDFNGSSMWASIPASPALAFGLGGYTLEAWIQPDALPGVGTYAPVISLTPATGTVYSILGLCNYGSGAQFAFRAASDGTNMAEPQITSILPQIGTTYHIVGTWDGAGKLKMYINGTKVADEDYGSEIAWIPIANAAHMLAASPTHFFNGKIDEPAIYGNVLDGSQILRHYQTGIDTG